LLSRLNGQAYNDTALSVDTINAREFDARNGVQNIQLRTRNSYVSTVRDGDIDANQDAVQLDNRPWIITADGEIWRLK